MNYIISQILFYSMVLCYFMVSIAFWFHLDILPYLFPVSVLISMGGVGLFHKSGFTNKEISKSILYSLVIYFVSISISHLLYDYSYDGQNYHQIIADCIMKGWNPYFELSPVDNVWVQHYPKCLETISAVVAMPFGDIEIGKSINIIFLASLFFIVADFLKLFFQKKYRLIFSFLLTLPAVVLTQLFTFYIDWFLYFIVAYATITFLNITYNRFYYISILNLAIIGLLAICTKANFAVWIFILYCIFVVVLFIKKDTSTIKRSIICCSLFIFIGIFINSYNPYVTNMLSGHHILYPLMGENSIDIMTRTTPVDILNLNYFLKVIVSLLAVPSNIIVDYNFLSVQFWYYALFDARIGGFGILFSIILLYSVLSLIYLNIFRGEYKQFMLCDIICLILFICLFILPYGWWARYVCFFALFPVIILFYTIMNNHRFVSKVLLILLLVNSSLTFMSALDHAVSNRIMVDIYISNMKLCQPVEANLGNNYAFRERLRRGNIELEENETEEFKLPIWGPPIYITEDYRKRSKIENKYSNGLYNYYVNPLKDSLKSRLK